MKKILYPIICSLALIAAGSCSSNFLETNSPSVVDADFVFSNVETARAAMYGVYESWRNAGQNVAFGDGLYYALDIAGSDIERHPEKFSNQPGRHWPECLYQNGAYVDLYGLTSYQKDGAGSFYSTLFAVVGKANALINAIEKTPAFEDMVKAETPTDISTIYGEAITARAVTYRELIKYFGDVQYAKTIGKAAGPLAPRDSIYDLLISDLERVIPLMYPLGKGPTEGTKNNFSKTFAQGLLARICMDAAGYQTRRGDFMSAGFYKDGKGQAITFENLGTANSKADGAVYCRRSNWKEYVAKAQKYYKEVIDDPGTAVLYTKDPRGEKGTDGKTYGNPYQYFFQQNNDLEYADESIYEFSMTQGGGNDARPYSFGRPSSGGGSNSFPCKSYGQGRINPVYYYGVFDPNDKRRDVSICFTGSKGNGAEKLISFAPNSKAEGGGLSLNKWDECRMENPYVISQRKSGINGPYMRMAEIYLGYAETCALLDDDNDAKTYLKIIRERSFPSGKANTDAFISKCGSVYKAVIEERGFEFAGEGDRRWTLIRTGLLPEKIKKMKDMTEAMINGLKNDGYYTFENGNTISNNIWTKFVDAKSLVGWRLTTETPDGLKEFSDEYGVLYPGWRGQNDDWSAIATALNVSTKNLTAGDKTNLAVQGLFSKVDNATAATLKANGYTETAWGSVLVSNSDEYLKYNFYDYDYTSAPIYLMPFPPTVMSTGGFDNGYGFRQE